MTLSRRDFMRLAALVAGSTALAGCGPLTEQIALQLEATGPAAGPVPYPAVGALGRMCYGVTAVELDRVAEIGLEGWIEEQLAPLALDDRPTEIRLRRFDTLDLDANELADRERADVVRELRQATLLRQIHSRRQLYETVVEFWSDHFNIAVAKGPCWALKSVDDRVVIRPNTLGAFPDLLLASARSPAMLVYLDNQANRRGAPNENYARELLELHTLGVDGGYTQRDVAELARCLTGWSVKRRFFRGEFTFDTKLHDPEPKEVLALHLTEPGPRDAERVLDHLSRDPRTARHLARKMARRYIGDPVEPTLVERAARAFERSDYEIPALLRVILLEGLARREEPLVPRLKRPVEFVTSAIRRTGARSDAGRPLLRVLDHLGHSFGGWPMPDGYPDHDEAWIYNLYPRWQFAFALAANRLDGSSLDLAPIVGEDATPATVVDRLSERLLGLPLPAESRTLLLDGLGAEGSDLTAPALAALLAGGIMASPAFQWR